MGVTRISTIRELKNLYIEGFLNNTDKVTKVSDESVNNAIAYGVSKIGQKTLKEFALIESHLFPDDAFGQHLDDVAQKRGISARFQASGSSAYLRIVAQPGTTYTTSNIFRGQGKAFELIENVTVGESGYIYAKVRCQETGKSTNVDPLTITTVSPAPNGHIAVFNEYQATGGRSVEDDESLRLRIKNGANIAAKTTLEYYTQILMKFNNDVLRVYSSGVNKQNQHILSITTQNGVLLTQDELNQLTSDLSGYLSIGEFNSVSNASANVELRNIEYDYVDVDFRIDLVQSANIDQVRKDIQIEMTKYLDPRYWIPGDRVEWDDLLQIVKEHSQIKNVADEHFSPRVDIVVDPSRLPRVRKFVMRDFSGSILTDNQGVIAPTHYPNEHDLAFQTTIVR